MARQRKRKAPLGWWLTVAQIRREFRNVYPTHEKLPPQLRAVDLGEEIFERPITLPVFKVARHDEAAERREIAERFAQQRVIRAGLDAWRLIGRAESFDSWKAIGAALAIGKAYAQRIADDGQTWRERNYIYALSAVGCAIMASARCRNLFARLPSSFMKISPP